MDERTWLVKCGQRYLADGSGLARYARRGQAKRFRSEEDAGRAARYHNTTGTDPAIDSAHAMFARVEEERRACDVCGEASEHHYEIRVDGVALDVQLDLCSDHGARYLFELGRVAGELLRSGAGLGKEATEEGTPGARRTLPNRFLLMPYRVYAATEWSAAFTMTREIAESMIATVGANGWPVGEIPVFDRVMDHMHPNVSPIFGWAKLEAADDGVWVVLCRWGDEALARESLEGETHLVPALELGGFQSKARFLYLFPTNQPQFDDVGKLPAA